MNGTWDVFVRDRVLSTTELVSIDLSGGDADSDSYYPSISADGRYLAFGSDATDLVAGDTNGRRDAFVRDRLLGVTELVSVALGGGAANGYSKDARITADGRYVAFYSDADDLVTGDTNSQEDVFIRDRSSNTTQRVSLDSSGVEGDNSSTDPAISANGRFVAFVSKATNLITGDTNGAVEDIFLRDTCGPVMSYCTAGISSNLCTPSMSASGLPCASAPSGFVLTCSGLDGQRFGLVFYGVSGRIAQPWGPQSSSWLCVSSGTVGVQRTPAANSGGGAGSCSGVISVDWLAFVSGNPTALGAPVSGGEVVQAQCWYRDPPAPRTTNLSDAIE
jgi:hypothetical protein